MKSKIADIREFLQSKRVKSISVCLIFFILFTGYFFFISGLTSPENKFLFRYFQAKHIQKIMPDYKILIDDPEKPEAHYQLTASEYYRDVNEKYDFYLSHVTKKMRKGLFESLLLFWIGFALFFYFQFRFQENVVGKYVRGAKLITTTRLKNLLKKEGRARFKIGPVPLPIERETDHVLYIGSIGYGQKVDLMRNIRTAVSKNFPCIIFDFNGDMIAHFYREGVDHIFNIADPRSINWQLPNDLKYNFDFEAVATALIPIKNENDEIGLGARDIFAGILRYCARADKFTNEGIYETLSLEPRRLKWQLKSWVLHEYIGNPKMMRLVRHHTRFFEYLQNNKDVFSIIDWIDNPRGNIFLSGYQPMEGILNPLHAVFIDMIARQVLLLPETQHRRFFFFLDDFETLQVLPSLPRLLTGENKRASVWIAMKSVSVLFEKYSKENITAIMQALKTKLIFNINDSAVINYLSGQIGIQERLIKPDDILKKENPKEITIKKALVHPEDLGRLPEFAAYLKMAGCFAAKVNIEKDSEDEFIPDQKRLTVRDDLSIKIGRELSQDLDEDVLKPEKVQSFIEKNNLPVLRPASSFFKPDNQPVPVVNDIKSDVKKDNQDNDKNDTEEEYIKLDLKDD
jgi:hypothetical protein